MSRKIKISPVESLVTAYLKRLSKTNKVRTEKKYLDKAAKLIGITLHDPCCPPAEEITLGLQENFLTVQLVALLNGIDTRKWRESLERAKKSLEDKVVDPCCELTQLIQGTIRVNGLAGSADITLVQLDYMGLTSPVFVSGDNLPQTAGQTGQFTILNGTHTLTVYGDTIQAGMKWRITDSDGTVQEEPYVGGNSVDFFNVVFGFAGAWTIEVIPV